MPTEIITPRFCPLVGRITNTVQMPFKRGKWQLARCLETDFVFLPDPPNYSELAEEHAWQTTFEAERERRKRDEPAFAFLATAIKRVRRKLFQSRNPIASMLRSRFRAGAAAGPLRIVDIGCSHAASTIALARRLASAGLATEVIGIEVSHKLAVAARERLAEVGGTVIESDALHGLASLDGDSIDAVVLSSFLEHEAKPLDLLKETRRCLRATGVAIAKVPNFACWNRSLRGARWCGFRYPDHVSYFTPKTIRMLAANACLHCEQSLLDRLPFSDNMYAVFTKSAL